MERFGSDDHYESCVERVLMADITSYGALSRHITEYLTTDKRVKYYKCKTLQNPDYCFNGKLYTPVDTTYKANTVTSAGSISLASKGIVSVGIKNADDQYKFIGLRPDENRTVRSSLKYVLNFLRLTVRRRLLTCLSERPFLP